MAHRHRSCVLRRDRWHLAFVPASFAVHSSPFWPSFRPCSLSPVFRSTAERLLASIQCTNCASACKRCDEARPCERCKKYGLAESCIDGVRKERKKGIKRGPYKRKNRSVSGEGSTGACPRHLYPPYCILIP